MAKSKKAAKKPASKRAGAAATSPKRPAKKRAGKPATKPSRPAAAPNRAKKPAPKGAKAAPRGAVSAKSVSASAKASKPANASKSGAASKPVKAPSAPVPVPLPVIPKVEAPGKFRREYRRWKDLLITLRQRLMQEGSHLEEEGLKAIEQEVSVDHMADFGSDSAEQETTLQLIESNSISVRDVDDALKRIEARTFGLCEECEMLIPPARLAIIPHARLCIACQSKREGMPA